MILPGRVKLGQVLVYVGRPLVYLFIWDVLVTIAWLGPVGYRIRFPTLPLPLLGSAIVIYLTFRNSTAYARWWEARTLWGVLANQSRSFARELQLLLPKDTGDLCRRLTLRQIAYAHALRMHLRREAPWSTLDAFLPPEECVRLKTVANVPSAILLGTAALIRDEARLDSVQQATLAHTMREITSAAGGMDRIRNTPFPQQYASYPALFTQVFCILLPIGLVDSLGIFTPLGSTVVGFLFLALLQIGNDMEHPFDNTVNDVPMSALTRVIEIDLRDGLGEAHELRPVQPVKGVLW